MIAEPTGTDGLRLRCRQFYTSSISPLPHSLKSSKSPFQYLRPLLSLRRSAGLGRKTFPTASRFRSGRLCWRGWRTMHPTAQ
jgi:hypothetical protein